MSENIRFFINEGEVIDDNADMILRQMSEAEGVVKPVIALPDLHFKLSYHTPTGVVVLAKDRVVPKFVNANCGMSFITTPFFAEDLDEKKMDEIFSFIREHITVSTRMEPVISQSDLEEIITRGAAWTIEKRDMDPADLKNFENEGSVFKYSKRSVEDIMSVIPRTCRDVGLLSLGVLGYGNHFIELQTVDKVVNSGIAERFGIEEGQLCFMIHGDSRGFGQSLIDFYSKKTKKLMGIQQAYKKLHYGILASKAPLAVKRSFEKVNYYLNRTKSTVYWKLDGLNDKKNMDFSGFEEGTKEAEEYIVSTLCALNYGYANRAYLTSVIRDAFMKVLGPRSSGIHILHDGNHDSLQKEEIDGNSYYVHRNGAARALPPGYYPDHPVFSHTGQPVLLPSSLGRHSYLCAASKGCSRAYYSACHGTGRIIDRGEARDTFKAEDVFKEISSAGMKVYDYGKGKTGEESPGAFRDVETVLRTMVDNDIAEPVVRLKPMAALKGWR